MQDPPIPLSPRKSRPVLSFPAPSRRSCILPDTNPEKQNSSVLTSFLLQKDVAIFAGNTYKHRIQQGILANYTTTANVVLSVNGKQAQKMLATLEKDAKRLERELAKASTAGDKATMKKLQRELKSTQRMMEQLKGSSTSVDATLRRLDKATPKELNKALKLLQQQLNGIQRGTATWDAQIAKIKAVKAELQKVNATLATQKSLWSRMNTWLNNAQTAIMAFAAAVTGLVMAGRKAVQSYADGKHHQVYPYDSRRG